MKCNICGKEFGNSVKCEHCGADRVAALGNYSGYSPSAVPNSVNKTQAFSEPSVCNETKGTGFSVCYACGEVIPADAKYCPKCAKKLYETCPKCGKTYSSQYTICQYCGTDRIKYIEEQQRIEKQKREEQERQRQIRAMEALREAQQREAQEAEERRLQLKQERKKHREKIAREKAEKILTDIENKTTPNEWIGGCIITFLCFLFIGLLVWPFTIDQFMSEYGGYYFLFFLISSCALCPGVIALFNIVIRNKQVRLINDYINAHPNSPETIYMIGVRNTLMDCIFTPLRDLISRFRVHE